MVGLEGGSRFSMPHIKARDLSNGSKWLYFKTNVKELARKLLSLKHKQKDRNMSINPHL